MEKVPFKLPPYTAAPCTEEDRDYVRARLNAVNFALVPPAGAQKEYCFLKAEDAAGHLIGGCILCISPWKLAHLEVLWIQEDCRRQGIGSALVREAERLGREKGCSRMLLETFDFQARPFYEKNAYKLCGTIRDWPRGHANYSLLKRLDRPEEDCLAGRSSSRCRIGFGSREDAELIGRRLGEYNSAQARRVHSQFIPLDRKLLDEKGRMAAAVFAGVSTWNNLGIQMIWVEEPFRNQGIGSRLLAETEGEAQSLGAYCALIDGVYDWESRFFIKNGYSPAGCVEDYPKGHAMLTLEKRF